MIVTLTSDVMTHDPPTGAAAAAAAIAVTAVINLPASGGRKEFVFVSDQPSLHSYLIL